MVTRVVAAVIWAYALRMLKKPILSRPMTNTWPQFLALAMRKLRRLTAQTQNNVKAPNALLMVRMLRGGMSCSAIFITVQLMPQRRQSSTSINFARMSPRPAAACLARLCS